MVRWSRQNLVAAIGIRATYRRDVLLFVDGISRSENAVVYREGFSSEAESLAIRFRDEPDNLADIRLQTLPSAIRFRDEPDNLAHIRLQMPPSDEDHSSAYAF